MIEFFLSKVWAFIVAFALMGVLFQGVQMEAREDRAEALQDVAERFQELLLEAASKGQGFEMALELDDILPYDLILEVNRGYAALRTMGEELHFTIEVFELLLETSEGAIVETDSIVLISSSQVLIVTAEEGLTMIDVSPRTSPPGI